MRTNFDHSLDRPPGRSCAASDTSRGKGFTMRGPPLESAENLAELRQRMVRDQIARRGVDDQRVLQAMRAVPREEFVPFKLRSLAYTDQALPIACHQTISQPYTVAVMCQALQLNGTERVLEVGTGSGYGAAVLSPLAAEVVTVERIPELAKTAAERLQKLGYDNVRVHVADGSEGWSAGAPYDAIVVTAAAEKLPQPYLDQLKDGGRIVIPVGDVERQQTLCRITRRDGRTITEKLGPFAFVPLIGTYGCQPAAVSTN